MFQKVKSLHKFYTGTVLQDGNLNNSSFNLRLKIAASPHFRASQGDQTVELKLQGIGRRANRLSLKPTIELE